MGADVDAHKLYFPEARELHVEHLTWYCYACDKKVRGEIKVFVPRATPGARLRVRNRVRFIIDYEHCKPRKPFLSIDRGILAVWIVWILVGVLLLVFA